MITYFETANKYQQTLRGLVHQGDNTHSSPILIVHGFFSSNKIGPYRLYYLLAEHLRQMGYSVYRVDFSAMGESDGISENITFKHHSDDLDSIVNYILSDSNSQKIHLLSHCFGCCTALAYLKSNINRIDSVTFLSPFIPQEKSFQKLLGSAEWDCYQRRRAIYHRGMYCDRSFIEKGFILVEKDYLKYLQTVDFMAFIPQNDEFCESINIIKWASDNSFSFSVIEHGDHNYLNRNGRDNLFNTILNRFSPSEK